MDITPLETALRQNAETLQYAAFFGLFALLGLAELRLHVRKARRKQRWLTNGVLTMLCVITIGALPVTALMAADYADPQNIGLLNHLAAPAAVLIAVGVLVRTLLSYLIHVAFHTSPWLWRIHAVHHTDTDMDVTTSVRMHPLEFVISAAMLLPCIVAFGIPVAAVLIYEVADAAMAVFTHANIKMPRWLDRSLRWVLVTPAMHRIHHSAWQPETDSNYGATLSMWDRAFGTYRATAREGEGPEQLGVEWSAWRRDSDDLKRLLLLPVTGLRSAARISSGTTQETL